MEERLNPDKNENFLVWKLKLSFQVREAELAGKLTGRQLFLRDATLNLSDVALMQAAGNEIEFDESLFEEVCDLFLPILYRILRCLSFKLLLVVDFEMFGFKCLHFFSFFAFLRIYNRFKRIMSPSCPSVLSCACLFECLLSSATEMA